MNPYTQSDEVTPGYMMAYTLQSKEMRPDLSTCYLGQRIGQHLGYFAPLHWVFLIIIIIIIIL